MGTLYMLRDWTSATSMRNEIHPSWRVRVCVYRDCEQESIRGYSLEVYEKKREPNESCDKLIYKFDVDTNIDGHYSLSTPEAIELLNIIGFNCTFDYRQFRMSDKVREQLTNAYNLGYKMIVRVVRPYARVFLSTDPEDDIERRLFNEDTRKILRRKLPAGIMSPEIFDWRDYLFMPPNVPTPIKELLGIKED